MNIKDIHEKAVKYFSDWVKINDDKSHWTIEYFHIREGVNETMSFPHCWKCVTVNHCWFIDQEGLRPQEFDYNKYQVNELLDKEGLYHPNCHCDKQIISTPQVKDIEILLFEDKMDGVYEHKGQWVSEVLGYPVEDKEIFKNIFFNQVKKKYVRGEYKYKGHNKYGFKINIEWILSGGKNAAKKEFKIKSGFMIYPDGKLRIVTILGGKAK